MVATAISKIPRMDAVREGVVSSRRGFVGADCAAAVTEAALECVRGAVDVAGADVDEFSPQDFEVRATSRPQASRTRGCYSPGGRILTVFGFPFD